MMRHASDVEQILFGWTAKGGLGITRHSPGLTDLQVDSWAERLSRYIRLTPTMVNHRPWVPKKAFSYFEFGDGRAALLARFDTGESGRNTSHALVGSSLALDPHAMALSTWDGWFAEDFGSSPPSLDPRGWVWEAWQNNILIGVHDRRADAIALAREVLRGDATHFTVVVDLDYSPLLLLALVRDVLDPVLSVPGRKFGWTFSTYEESDTTPEASPSVDGSPRFWFVRSLPTSGQTDRRRVLLGQQSEDDPHAGLAADLIKMYLKNPEGYPAIIEQRLSGNDDPVNRVADLLEPYLRPAVPAHDPAPTSSQWATQSRPEPAVEVRPDVSTSDEAAGRRSGGNTMVTTQRNAAPQSMDVDQLLTTLHEGRGLTQQDVRCYVVELRNRWEAQNPYEANVRHMMNRVERRLTWHERVIGGAVIGLVVVALLMFLTARREVTVPAPPTVTVTETQPAPETVQPSEEENR